MATPAEILFHATRVSSRASIQRHGIDYTKNRTKPKAFRAQLSRMGWEVPDGNYLYEDMWSALFFADRFIPKALYEVWAVAATGLNLESDPEPVGKAWLSRTPIPPGNLLGIAWSHELEVPKELEWKAEEPAVGIGD